LVFRLSIVFPKSNHKITQIFTRKISDFWSGVNLVESRGLLIAIYYWNDYNIILFNVMCAIEVKDLVKRYRGNGFAAVDHISFNVESGEIFALLGPNGAGKTTAIRRI